MKLSIIVPVYNVKAFLADCIESILAQTENDYELILIDDGSTDGSADIIADYAGRYPYKIKTLRVENGGQGRARNFGIEMAKGEYLGFVDSDDWVERTMYEKLLERAWDTDADLVYCDFMGRYDDGRTEYLSAALQDNKMSAAGSSCNKIFRRELVGDVRFPVGLWYEDFSFSAMMLMKASITEYIREPLYIYRCGQESTMHNNNSMKNLDIIRIMDGLEDTVLTERGREDFNFLLINHMLLDSINRLMYQNSPDKLKAIRELQSYVKKHIPKLLSCESFKQEKLRRRVIMFLNYHHLESASKCVFKMKKKLEAK